VTSLEERHNVAYVLLEAKVDHAVRLVHAKVPAVIEHETPLLEHVLKAARRRDDDMEALAQYARLVAHADSADAKERVQVRILAIPCQRVRPREHVLVRLRRELARGAQNDAHRALTPHEWQPHLRLKREHNQWEAERERLP
jgi:hypothetical protein